MGYASAGTTEAGTIPIIDIRALRDGGDRKAVARELHRASRDVGFIYVSHHGIDDA